MSCPFPFHVGRHRCCCDRFFFLILYFLSHELGNPGGESRHTGFETSSGATCQRRMRSNKWENVINRCCTNSKQSYTRGEAVDSNNRPNRRRRSCRCCIEDYWTANVSLLTYAYYKWSHIFGLAIEKWITWCYMYTDDKLLREIHFSYLLHMWIQ